MAAAVEARSLDLGYRNEGAGTVSVLSGVDLTVDAGEFLSILGPSGCGKSTLLRVIADLLDPLGERSASSARVRARRDVRARSVSSSRIRTLLPWRTVTANIELPYVIGGRYAVSGAPDRTADCWGCWDSTGSGDATRISFRAASASGSRSHVHC